MAKLECIDLEQNILGLLLHNGELVSQCTLSESDFSQQSHRIIFSAINKVLNDGYAIDLVSVGESIERQYRTVDMDYMTKLVVNRNILPSNIAPISNLIRQASRHRKAKDIAIEMTQRITSDDECSNLVENAIRGLMEIDSHIKNHEHTIAQSVDAALEAGAEDVVTHEDGSCDVFTSPEDFGTVKDALDGAGLEAVNAEVTMFPSTKADLDASTAPKFLRLIDNLEDHDDVQEVYHNAEISEDVMETLE